MGEELNYLGIFLAIRCNDVLEELRNGSEKKYLIRNFHSFFVSNLKEIIISILIISIIYFCNLLDSCFKFFVIYSNYGASLPSHMLLQITNSIKS